MTATRFDGIAAVLAADIAEVAAHLFVACFLDDQAQPRYADPGGGSSLHEREAAQALGALGGFERDLGLRGRADVNRHSRVVVREASLLWQFALLAAPRDSAGGTTLLRRGLAVLSSSDPLMAARVSLVAVCPPEPFRRLGEVVAEV